MSKIHVRTNINGKYAVTIHFNTPSGNNSAGNSWKDCLVSDERNTTSMTEGSGVGQISITEMNSIIAGSKIEIVESLRVESGGATTASLDELADTAINAAKSSLQARYKYYGYTQG